MENNINVKKQKKLVKRKYNWKERRKILGQYLFEDYGLKDIVRKKRDKNVSCPW